MNTENPMPKKNGLLNIKKKVEENSTGQALLKQKIIT